MPVLISILIGLAILVFLIAAVSLAVRLGAPKDGGGDEKVGLVVFCSGLRWFGVRWGKRGVPAGLRKAGFAGRFVYWDWHVAWRGWLALPALKDAKLMQREAKKISEFIVEQQHTFPDRPIYLLGCSAGGHLALRALELLPAGASVEAVGLISPAVDCHRNLTPVLDKFRSRLVLTYSLADWLVLGLGTWLFGTADRKHAVSAGMVGFKNASDDRIIQIPWRPGMIFSGRLGGHPTAEPPKFIAKYLAPAMGIGQAVS